jgi:hypothetical protein
LIWFDHGQYSVPHRLAGQTVPVRRHGEQVVITHVGAAGAVEVARHQITTQGDRRVDDTDFPQARRALARTAHQGEDLRKVHWLAVVDRALGQASTAAQLVALRQARPASR